MVKLSNLHWKKDKTECNEVGKLKLIWRISFLPRILLVVFFVFVEVVDTRLRQSRHSCKPQQQQLKYLTIHAMSLLPGLEFNISTPWSSVAHESLPCHDNHQSLHSVGWGFSVTLRVDRLLQPFKGQVVTCEGKVWLPYMSMYVLLVSSHLESNNVCHTRLTNSTTLLLVIMSSICNKWTGETGVNSPCLFTTCVQIWSLCDHPVKSYE